MTLILSEADSQATLRMEDCVRVLEETFADFGNGDAVSRPRTHTYTYREPGTFYNYKSMDGGVPRYGVHALRMSSEIVYEKRILGGMRRDKIGAAAGGRFVGLVMLFDMATTELLAIMQDSVVQRMRVGATSGIAAKFGARSDARRVGLFGTGWQAGPQLEALALVRPIESVAVYSPNPEHRRAFVAEMAPRFAFPITAVEDPREVVTGADIVACATNAQEPVFDGSWLVSGQHVNSLQAGELDATTHERADRIIVRAAERSQHYVQKSSPEPPIETVTMGRFTEGLRGEIVELGAIAAGRARARTNDAEITLFGGSGTGPSSGLGIQFAAVGKLVYDRARELGLGHEVPTEWFSESHHP
jgi:alanine dehydrogenase